MFPCVSGKYEALLLTAVGRSMIASSLHLMLDVGAEAGDAHQTLEGSGENRLSTNLFYLKKCKEITSKARAKAAPKVAPFEALEMEEDYRLNKYARLAEVLASSKQSPGEKYSLAGDLLGKLVEEGHSTDETFDVMQVLLLTRKSAAAILFGEVSTTTLHICLDIAVAYLLGNNPNGALMHITEAKSILNSLVEDSSTKTHLHAKTLFAEAVATLNTDYSRSQAVCRNAINVAERLYTDESGLGWYRLLDALVTCQPSGEHQSLFDKCDEYLQHCSWSHSCWILVPLLRQHCEILRRADVELRAPAVAQARKRLLTAVQNAATKADLQLIEKQLRADVSAIDEKARVLKLTVVRQADHICGICELWLQRSLKGAEGVASMAGLVAVVGARAAHRVERLELARRFAYCAEVLLAPRLGAAHPLVALNRISLGSPKLFRASSTMFALIRTCSQLDICPPPLPDAISASVDALATTISDAVVIALLEETLEAILSKDTATSREFGPLLSCIAALKSHYDTNVDGERALMMLAMWADVLQDFLGPQHPLTLAKVDEFVKSRRVIFPPRFSPGGGVLPLLTTVNIQCDTDDAQVYIAFNGDTPVNADGVNSSERSPGSITLDKVGSIVVKAIAFRGDGKSQCIEARFMVTNSTL